MRINLLCESMFCCFVFRRNGMQSPKIAFVSRVLALLLCSVRQDRLVFSVLHFPSSKLNSLSFAIYLACSFHCFVLGILSATNIVHLSLNIRNTHSLFNFQLYFVISQLLGSFIAIAMELLLCCWFCNCCSSSFIFVCFLYWREDDCFSFSEQMFYCLTMLRRVQLFCSHAK